MSPAARLKHARHALAGLLVPATWLALAGTAQAEDKDAPATTTTTAAPATTTTTTTTAPAPPLSKEARRNLEASARAQALLDALDEGDTDPDVAGPTAEPVPPVAAVAPSADRPAPPSILIDDLPAGLPVRITRAQALAQVGGVPVAPVAPVPLSGLPTGDDPTSSGPAGATGGGFAFSPGPTPSPSTGWPGLAPGATAPPVDPAVGAVIGWAPAAIPGNGLSLTGQAENPERGPPGAAITTGDADATGNQTVTTIDQSTLVVVTRRGIVSLTTAENRDTGATWRSVTLPTGLLGGRQPWLLGAITGGRTADGTVTITTGNALASGNLSSTTINQSTTVVVTARNQNVDVGQPASVANVGTATAGTGGNTGIGTVNDGSGAVVITTGDAIAYGNRSTTVINQDTMVVITGSNSSVRVGQWAEVDNIGTATAITGENSATGSTGTGAGDAVIRTGSATAIGNQSTTTITQNSVAVVTGNRSTVNIDQDADVDNIGTATASTGGNAAVATSGGSNGSVLITTGQADATGNVAGTTITQTGISITTGKFAGISITQGAGVQNAGTAVATTGGNTAVGVG